MMSSPPGSPEGIPKRPQSAAMRPPRSNSRMSLTSNKQGGSSRLSDDDSKTAVKVAVRVRPPLKSTDPGFELIPQRFQKSMVHVTSPTSLAIDVSQGRKLFVFDRVFDPDVTQEGIWDYLQESVNSFVQGYNVSILAYGQSGAGKSFTMGTSGPSEQSDIRNMGVIPRAAAYLFEKLNPQSTSHRPASGIRTPTRYSTASLNHTLQNLSQKDWQLKATYVEIYNEQLRDLLLPESTPPHERATVTIREDPKGRILLTGLHQVNINTIEDLLGALNFGSSIRQTDATAINAKSSRSHAVFSLNLVQQKSAQTATSAKEKRFSVPIEAMSGSQQIVTFDSKLHFVDLAGSERLKNTGASGERAKEGISINAGLASLGKVISQLSSRQAGSHVSYRDSRLTRLLQDSLGGNAITYMIACVTPAEFHLSETLNTVQYAQRARAIQSKPRLQQVSDESDKQAVIDRLKAEVAFLRQQLRNTEGGDRRPPVAERSERQNEREIELQSNLLDVHESYNALSQRHAKLIAELAHSGDSSLEAHNITGESAIDRLKRSQANQQQIESMVLEYEKTIQALETNLSTTRAALATTESSLLEKETKCAYSETLNQQLHARLQKLLDRETNTETYLHELEAKLDGQSNGEERSSALVMELRKEIARLRENEGNSEDYISTLEERLAEADQDIELMQREVERLEHVVERQRSLGKLDNLLYELDHIQQNGRKSAEPKSPQSVAQQDEHVENGELQKPDEELKLATETAIPEETDEELAEDQADGAAQVSGPVEMSDDGLEEIQKVEPILIRKPSQNLTALHNGTPESPAQSKFVAEKLENVTQELFDLRLEHDSTLNDFDLLSAKYQEALRTLAELQDAVDEAKHPAPPSDIASPTKSRPQSFLEDPRVHELKGGVQVSTSRSLSSELSLAGEPPMSPVASENPQAQRDYSGDIESGEQTTARSSSDDRDNEITRLTTLLAEHEEGMNLVTQQYAQLQAEHQETLSAVEDLRAEVQKTKFQSPSSPREPPHVIRRQTSQSMVTVDRAHRSLASLRNIAVEEFETRPDTMQSVEVHINTTMHELHSRMERIQALEAENKSVKKEMEQKAAMITGLTRERNSMKASSPLDISLVGQMQDQLRRSETEMHQIHEDHAAKEKHLQAELESVKTQHAAAVEERDVTEKKLATSIAELEALTAAMETMRARSSASETTSLDAMDNERAKHQELVDKLKQEIDGHAATVASHESRVAELEQQHAATEQLLLENSRNAEAKERESNERIDELMKEIEEHKSAVETHKLALESAHGSHEKKVAELQLAVESAKTEHEDTLRELIAQHDNKIKELDLQSEQQLTVLREQLENSHREHQTLLDKLSEILGESVTGDNVSSLISQLMKSKQQAVEMHTVLAAQNVELSRQLENNHGDRAELEKQISEHSGQVAEYKERIRSLAEDVAVHEETIREKETLLKKRDTTIESLTTEKQNSARIIEELEQQIESSFDQHHNRLSVMQEQGTQALDIANKRVSVLEKELEEYKTRIEHVSSRPQSPPVDPARSNSLTSNLRKSASVASLPSPPPAIPLPPLPSIAQAANGSPSNASASPPQSRHTSKDISSVHQHQAQLIEDQEARIRTIEKHLHAEKQLTATLEEALVDLETQSNKVRADMETWKKKAWSAEEELQQLRREQKTQRLSVQQVEEERDKRREAEAARAHLEERMQALSKKKKKSGLNCF